MQDNDNVGQKYSYITHSNFLLLLVKSICSSSQGTKGRLIDLRIERMLASEKSAKLTSRERSSARLHPLRDADSMAPARVKKTVLASCRMRELKRGRTWHLVSGFASRRLRYFTWQEKQSILLSSCRSFSAKAPTSSRLMSSQSGQAVVRAVSSSSKPKKQSKRGMRVGLGSRMVRKGSSLSLRRWQMAKTTSFPTVMPKTGTASRSSPTSSSSRFSIPRSSSFSRSVSVSLCTVSSSSSCPPPTSNGRFSYSPASLKPSVLSRPASRVSSRYLAAAARRTSMFSWWMPRSKLQSAGSRGSRSRACSWGLFCLTQVVVFWLRILSDWQARSICSSCSSTDMNNFQCGTIIRAPPPLPIYHPRTTPTNSIDRQIASSQTPRTPLHTHTAHLL